MQTLVAVYPDEMYSLLVPSSLFAPPTSFFVDEVVVLYSPQRSNKRTQEEAVLLHWADYIGECSESSECIMCMYMHTHLTRIYSLPDTHAHQRNLISHTVTV